MEKVLKVTAIPRGKYPSDKNSTQYDPDKLIRIIDELILNSPDIPNTSRICTSQGMYNKQKCLRLKDFLEHKTDTRSLRIKNLLDRVLKLVEK